jgi:hypothetical protein
MNGTLLNIALMLVFVLIGGVFATAEMALVSLRESQLSPCRTAAGAARPSPRWPRTRTGSCRPCRSASP